MGITKEYHWRCIETIHHQSILYFRLGIVSTIVRSVDKNACMYGCDVHIFGIYLLARMFACRPFYNQVYVKVIEK